MAGMGQGERLSIMGVEVFEVVTHFSLSLGVRPICHFPSRRRTWRRILPARQAVPTFEQPCSFNDATGSDDFGKSVSVADSTSHHIIRQIGAEVPTWPEIFGSCVAPHVMKFHTQFLNGIADGELEPSLSPLTHARFERFDDGFACLNLIPKSHRDRVIIGETIRAKRTHGVRGRSLLVRSDVAEGCPPKLAVSVTEADSKSNFPTIGVVTVLPKSARAWKNDRGSELFNAAEFAAPIFNQCFNFHFFFRFQRAAYWAALMFLTITEPLRLCNIYLHLNSFEYQQLTLQPQEDWVEAQFSSMAKRAGYKNMPTQGTKLSNKSKPISGLPILQKLNLQPEETQMPV